jgi:hypothetical protein
MFQLFSLLTDVEGLFKKVLKLSFKLQSLMNFFAGFPRSEVSY